MHNAGGSILILIVVVYGYKSSTKIKTAVETCLHSMLATLMNKVIPKYTWFSPIKLAGGLVKMVKAPKLDSAFCLRVQQGSILSVLHFGYRTFWDMSKEM